MTGGLAKCFPSPVLEDEELLPFLLTDDLGRYLSGRKLWLTDGHRVAISNQINILQFNDIALLSIKAFNLDNIAGSDFILLPPGGNYCVHAESSFINSNVPVLLRGHKIPCNLRTCQEKKLTGQIISPHVLQFDKVNKILLQFACWARIIMPYYEFTIKIAVPYRDSLIKRLMRAGCLGVIDNTDSVIAYFPENTDIETITDDLSILKALLEKSNQPDSLIFDYTSIPDQDWNETWKKGFKPIDVGQGFTILPPWEKKRQGRINIVIDPAMAFGTGHHETTRSCLALIEKYAKRTGKERFLDLGMGTGILAIAASMLGYRTVVGVDTDQLAVDAARKNAKLNKVEGVEIRSGSIANVNETFDFIAANLTSGVLVLLAQELARHLKPAGIAVLSGILAGQEDEVIKAVTEAGLSLIELSHDGKWVSLAVVQRSG